MFRRFLLRISTNRQCCSFSTSVETEKTSSFSHIRTKEHNPENHSQTDLTTFYTVPESYSRLFQHGGLPKSFSKNCSTFNEIALMIRQSALDIIKLMKKADYSTPPLKYVLYGKPGVGKSLIMGHVLHYAAVSEWVLVHVPWVGNWLRSPKEVITSTKRPGFVELPENAIKWLVHFKTQNAELIEKLDLRLLNNYEWSIRESSKVGDSLLEIVDLGISRPKHASEIIVAVLSEVKQLTKQQRCKTLVAIDGFNGFFHSETRVRNEEKAIMPPEKVVFIPAFLEMTRSDWHNAAILVTCDELVVPGHDKSPFPLYQLGKKGFEHLDPFIPIEVPLMTNEEISNMLDYYKERRWLQNVNGDKELLFLSGNNPYSLMNLCAPL